MSLFATGEIVATPSALALCEREKVSPLMLIGKHVGGDWGEVCADDAKANVVAIQHDLRVVSVYIVAGVKVYVITEADRSSTCLMLANEY